MNIKTKEASSLLVAVLAAAIVALATALAHVAWWVVLCVAVGTFLIVALFALFVIRKYLAYKLKPIYSIVFSRNVHTHEILDELKDKHVESISEELSAWAETSDMEIGYITRKNSILSKVGNLYVSSLKKYLEQNTVSAE